MATLSGIPPEILQQIVAYTIPQSYDSARLSCRQFYDASQPFVARHREFVHFFRKWSLRSDHKDSPPPSVGSPLTDDHEFESLQYSPDVAASPARNLLMHIVRNPIAASYVQHLDLRQQLTYSQDLKVLVFNDKDRDFIRDHVLKTHVLREIEIDLWMQNLDHCVHVLLILLSLLPNIQSISTQREWSRPGYETCPSNLLQCLRTLIDQANENGQREEPELIPLSQLTEVRPNMDFGYDCKTSLLDIEPFLALDSVTECQGSSFVALEDGYTGIPWQRTFPVIGRNLHTLELHDCVIGVDEFSELLRDMTQLTRLCITLTTKWHGCGFEHNPGKVVGVITQSPCVNTLKYLELAVEPSWNDCWTGVDETVKFFSKLETLKIDAQWFQGPPYHLHTDFDEPSQTYGKGDRTQRTPRLDKLLPPSIKKFELVAMGAGYYQEELSGLFAGLTSELSREALPNMQTFNLYVVKRWAADIDLAKEPWSAIIAGWSAAGANIREVDWHESGSDYDLGHGDWADRLHVFSM